MTVRACEASVDYLIHEVDCEVPGIQSADHADLAVERLRNEQCQGKSATGGYSECRGARASSGPVRHACSANARIVKTLGGKQ